MNTPRKIWTIIGLFSILLVVLGHAIAGRQGVMWAVLISLSINSLLYFFGHAFVSSHLKGELVEGQDPWGLGTKVEAMARRAGLPRPRLLIIPFAQPQAGVLGRNWQHGTFFFTEGLIKNFSEKELEAVIALQLAALKRFDTLAFMVASAVTGALLTVTRTLDRIFAWIIGARRDGDPIQRHFFSFVVSPLLSLKLKLIYSPQEYFEIDKLAVEYQKDPRLLAEVLWKLDGYASTRPMPVSPALTPLFVVSPLTTQGWNRYFLLQPPVEKRIRRLIGHYPI